MSHLVTSHLVSVRRWAFVTIITRLKKKYAAYCLLGSKHDALVLLAPDNLQGLHKVLPAGLDRGRVLLVTGQVGVYKLDKAVEVLCSNLQGEEKIVRRHGFF